MKEVPKFYVGKDKDGRVYLYGPDIDRNENFYEPVVHKADCQWEFDDSFFDLQVSRGCLQVSSNLFPELNWEDEKLLPVTIVRRNSKDEILSVLKIIKEENEWMKDKEIQESLLEIIEKIYGKERRF